MTALASDIRLLSRVLSATHSDWSNPRLRRRIIPDLLDYNQPEPFSHISNLLSAQSDGVVAVVGALNQEDISVTISYSGGSAPLEAWRPITPSERDWKDILYRCVYLLHIRVFPPRRPILMQCGAVNRSLLLLRVMSLTYGHFWPLCMLTNLRRTRSALPPFPTRTISSCRLRLDDQVGSPTQPVEAPEAI